MPNPIWRLPFTLAESQWLRTCNAPAQKHGLTSFMQFLIQSLMKVGPWKADGFCIHFVVVRAVDSRTSQKIRETLSQSSTFVAARWAAVRYKFLQRQVTKKMMERSPVLKS